MRFTVVWRRDAEDELTAIWTQAADRRAVTEAARQIDRILRDNPEEHGEDFYGDRLLIELPLAVVFAVSVDDRRVTVLQVWHR